MDPASWMLFAGLPSAHGDIYSFHHRFRAAEIMPLAKPSLHVPLHSETVTNELPSDLVVQESS